MVVKIDGSEGKSSETLARRREILKSRIARNAHFFDLKALIDLLVHIGISPENIIFRGYMGNESQPCLIKSIRYQGGKEVCPWPGKPHYVGMNAYQGWEQEVILTLYFGLAGASSPLPSYFFQMAQQDLIDEEHFAQLLQFLDQVLIRAWVMALYPECFRTKIGVRDDRGLWLRKIHRLGTVASLHWLFHVMVPELQIRSGRTEFVEKNAVSQAQLGKSALGYQMILGHYFSLMAFVHKFTYISDSEFYNHQTPWHLVLQERLFSTIFPLISPLNLNIEVWLVIRESSNWLKLENSAYLGYERMRGEENKFKTILIYSGMPKDTGDSTI